ncbi:MAG: nuclease (SNase domain protein) [Rhodospirillales bacterium]|jgi:endonuclease YncB( thermonuclease family)|nr:nuclease (SNase domain protein) [Rhodospirillales bacterium]
MTTVTRIGTTLFTALWIAGAGATVSWAAERATLNRLDGPVAAEVLRVVDGDTIEVRAHIWLGQEVTTLVRLGGVDAPELKGKCESERAAARRAKARIEEHINGREVTLRDIRFEKYAGRVMSKVETETGEDLGTALKREGYVRAYGGAKRAGWCAG